MSSSRVYPIVPIQDPLAPSTHPNNASDERGYQRIRLRQDTTDNWLKNDPILASGEFGYVIGSTNPGEMLKIGDGTLRWSQLPWLMANGNSGPVGPAGPPGPPGPPVNGAGGASVSFGVNPPAGPDTGDLWLKPTSPATPTVGVLSIWDGSAWIQAGSVGTSTPTINTTKYNFGNPLYVIGGPPQIPNSPAARPDPLYPLQEYIDRIEAVMNSRWFLWGAAPTLYQLTVGNTSTFFGTSTFNGAVYHGRSFFRSLASAPQFGDSTVPVNLTVNGNVNITGALRYGGTLTQGPVVRVDPNDPNSEQVERSDYIQQFELPTPTENGYLRSDADDKNWYFAEPVIVSDVAPAVSPTLDGGATALWIDPNGVPAEVQYSNSSPPVSVDAPIEEMADGTPFGIVNNIYVEPMVVGAVPVMVNGRRYLLPLLEAPASAARRDPMFTFVDDPVKQQADGSWIGSDDTGMYYYQPETVAAIPVVVGGKRYLLPLMAE